MDVRSNAKIEAHDLSQILVHSIDSLTNNLQALTNAPPFQNTSDIKTGQVLLNASTRFYKTINGWLLLAG